MDEQRIIDLETKFSHQDVLIEELRQTVHAQYLTLERLEKTLNAIKDRIQCDDDNLTKTAHEKPPHY